ncbi:type IV conjugative transfer system protein TraE [Candidatus Regiella endosymbiont of Tuberolachnus salignus]|uniref:type IV conjugative transfer system protein TraE n=1 Tax=Candidatus Regiella endosymbiont of Tuberolachnus salignus TaxID=3077956 RepID=UPI0030CB286F
MELTARHSSNKIIAVTLLVIFLMLILSLISTILLAVDNHSLRRHQEKIVIPMAFNVPFAISEALASPAYLQMMALSFISLRLNVSPETVDAQHQFLLSFAKPGAQSDFKITLAEESRRIRQNEVSSAFYQTRIRVFPAESIVEIHGVLKTWIGNGKPTSEQKNYNLKLDYADGMTRIVAFLEKTDAKK